MTELKIFPNDFLELIKEDLKDLFHKDEISNAETLNKKFAFAKKQEPSYFAGKFNAKTVFVMLNPGGKALDNYSFAEKEKKKYSNSEHFFTEYMNKHINGGEDAFKRYQNGATLDNFDLKQAAFLYDFKESEIFLPDFFSVSDKEPRQTRQMAIRNVLMNKLQLELIPYCSAQFNVNVNVNVKENIDIFLPHIKRILDAIVSYDRKYVIFGSRKFYDLLKAYNNREQNTEIEFLVNNCYVKIEGLDKRVSYSIVKITYNDKTFHAIIANTFPRRDLPNAYEKMRCYGKLCWEELIKYM